MKKKFRKKAEIIDTLKEHIKETDKKVTNNLFNSKGNIIKNNFQKESNPHNYVGWLKTDDNKLIRIEAEQIIREGKDTFLEIKGTTIPEDVVVSMGLGEPNIPKYEKSNNDFM